jgi:hypothetical protein
MSSANPIWTPADVFYVVQSTGLEGEQQHRVCFVLYETRLQAEAELVRLRKARPDLVYSVWHSATYVEPHTWLYPVVLADGNVVISYYHNSRGYDSVRQPGADYAQRACVQS